MPTTKPAPPKPWIEWDFDRQTRQHVVWCTRCGATATADALTHLWAWRTDHTCPEVPAT